MTQQVIIALIGAAQAVLVVVLGKISLDLRRNKKSTEEVKEQVSNSHIMPDGTLYNLRDNIDNNQAAVLNSQATVLAEIRGVRRDVGRLDLRDINRGEEMQEINRKLDALRKSDDKADGRIGNIEDTLEIRKDS